MIVLFVPAKSFTFMRLAGISAFLFSLEMAIFYMH